LERVVSEAGRRLDLGVADDIRFWTDIELHRSHGVLVAFPERSGGVSSRPYSSLNLAAHVGDSPDSVDANRASLLGALGLAAVRDRLTMADQVHGEDIVFVDEAKAGAGAFALRGKRAIATTDALLTTQRLTPLMLCFADCVPVVLVAPGPAVAVVHAGWKGALASLPEKSAILLAQTAGCSAGEIVAYVGAHIRDCHYKVEETLLSQFVNTFGTFARADSGGLDLDAIVSASLDRAGVAQCNIVRLGVCSAEATERFYSYRAEGGVTGRHAALACIL
jgi:polyphenol oxidase